MYGFPFSRKKKKVDYYMGSGFIGNGNNKDFKKQILEKDEEIKIFLKKLEECNSNIFYLKEALTENKENYELKKQEFDGLFQEYDQLKKDMKIIKKERDDLISNISSQNRDIEKYKSSIKNIKDHLFNCNTGHKQISSEYKKCKESDSNNIEKLKFLEEQLKTNDAEYKKKIFDLETIILKFKKDIENLNIPVDEMRELIQVSAQTDNDFYEEIKLSNKKLKEEINDLRNENKNKYKEEEGNKYEKEEHKLKIKIDELLIENDQMRQENENLRRMIKEGSKLERQLDRVQLDDSLSSTEEDEETRDKSKLSPRTQMIKVFDDVAKTNF
jgi:chromosome segregation ATPase